MPNITLKNFRELPHRAAMALALPMIISNITIPLTGLVDTAMLGHFTNAANLGAAALGSTMLAFVFWIFAFLRMSTTAMTGRCLGAGDFQAMLSHLKMNGTIALVAGLLAILACVPLLPWVVTLMTDNPTLQTLAGRYCQIRVLGAPAIFLNFIALGWFVGLQNTRVPLLVTSAINGLNILLDYIFIAHLHWGSDGAALGSALANYVGLGFNLYFVTRELHRRGLHLSSAPAASRSAWRALFNTNADLFVRTALLLFVFNFFAAQGARLGEITLASNAILMQVVIFISYALDGYAHAAEAMVAKATGERHAERLMKSTLACLGAAVVIVGAFEFGLALGGLPLLQSFTDIPPIQTSLADHIGWLLLMPVLAAGCYILDGVFIGAHQTRVLRNWMIFAVVLVFLPLWWWTRPWQNHGLWLAFCVFNGFRTVSLGGHFFWLYYKRRTLLTSV